ncbi:MAG: hypothetical protein FWG18_03110 [Alphaproteobacteria bacterium]|nr:hypothetical protein [Alphaproteobacteria bacterium]
MKEVHPNLFIGNDADCRACMRDSDFAIVHACKTCHQSALGYTKSLPQDHTNYLIYETADNLFLNIVDMLNELQPKFTHPIVCHALDFINRKIKSKKVLVHCNQGLSRSTSLGMIYLINNGLLPKESYESAKIEFLKLYPDYMPGNGIELYMKNNWDYLIRINS